MIAERSVRCAIYTRKSSEEGLEQSFNSLHAQREACEAYILSQREEGWRAISTHYDDGGFSGGSIERPALKSLLRDIEAKKIDIVVVYKVDRLTRSLADFAKIIEAFDARGVSFVSVTQQFNTTSSMGRLTLNVLLSFAQFEREVTGERIRDKIAASKRKGMWMGGRVPVGYSLRERQLHINKEEAARVREIFRLYLKLGCVRRLKQHLDNREQRTVVRTAVSGRQSGGAQYSRGGLYKILRNRVYRGEVAHKEQTYAGEQEAIVDPVLWNKVQTKLTENAHARRHGKNAGAPSLLKGLLYDPAGNRFTPTHAVKNGKRYRYYLSQHHGSQPIRIPAQEIETLVARKLRSFLGSPDQLTTELATHEDSVATTTQLINSASQYSKTLESNQPNKSELLRSAVYRVVIQPESVELMLSRRALRRLSLRQDYQPGSTNMSQEEELILLTIPTKLKRCGGEKRLVIHPDQRDLASRTVVPSLLQAISRAHHWVAVLEAGIYKDQREIAVASGLDERYVSRILPAAFLAPELVEAIVEGRQSPEITLDRLLVDLRLAWRSAEFLFNARD